MEHLTKDIETEQLENRIASVLFHKYRQRSPQDAGWLARDDASVIVRHLDVLGPILKEYLNG